MDDPVAVTGTYNIQATAKDGKVISIQGYMYAGLSQRDMNLKLDLAQDLADRQLLRAEIPLMEKAHKMKMKQLDDLRAHMADAEGKLQRGEKLTSTAKQGLQNGNTNVEHILGEIQELDGMMLAARKKLDE